MGVLHVHVPTPMLLLLVVVVVIREHAAVTAVTGAREALLLGLGAATCKRTSRHKASPSIEGAARMLASHSYEERIDSLTDLEAACIATLDVQQQQQQQQQQHSLAVLCSSPCCCSRLNKSMLETKASAAPCAARPTASAASGRRGFQHLSRE